MTMMIEYESDVPDTMKEVSVALEVTGAKLMMETSVVLVLRNL